VTSFVQRFLPRLRYPYLFVVLGSLLLIDLIVPDPVPLVDELILAVLTLLTATLTTRPAATPEAATPDEDPERSLPSGNGEAPDAE
jgi:hypothetical protein